MSELREIIKHIEEIHKLLLILESKQEVSEEEETNEEANTEANHKRTRSIFNSSKFLNKDEREKVIQFLDDKVMNDINKLPAHKQASYTKLLIKKHLNINISTYMVNKILTLKRQQTHDNDDDDNDNNNNNNQRRPQLI